MTAIMHLAKDAIGKARQRKLRISPATQTRILFRLERLENGYED